MKMLEAIKNAISDYDVAAEVTGSELKVINPKNAKSLSGFEEEYWSRDMKDGFVEDIVEFSTQHRHFSADEEDGIIDYIKSIMNDEVLPLEFYLDGKRRFGGEIEIGDLDMLSVSYLSEKYGYEGRYFLPFEYELSSWSGEHDTGRRRASELKP